MQKANFRLLVLHEDELRAAAKLLQKALDAQESGDPEAFNIAAKDAMNACIVALHGLHDEVAFPIAMVSSTRRLIENQDPTP